MQLIFLPEKGKLGGKTPSDLFHASKGGVRMRYILFVLLCVAVPQSLCAGPKQIRDASDLPPPPMTQEELIRMHVFGLEMYIEYCFWSAQQKMPRPFRNW